MIFRLFSLKKEIHATLLKNKKRIKGETTMGYTTTFEGCFGLDRKLDDKTYVFLEKLANTRRMKRCSEMLEEMGYGEAHQFGMDGEFFVDGDGYMGQDTDASVINSNKPPFTQPSLWCQWIPLEDRKTIVWDEGEKFYCAKEWIEYIVNYILAPKGYILNGAVNAQGEERGDNWHIIVKDNEVLSEKGFTTIR